MKPMRSRRSIRGLSLIEVMISLAIGLVVVGAVIVSYLGSGKASRYQSALSQMNLDAQIGLNILSREVQLAGYSAPSSMSTTFPAGTGTTPVWVVTYNLGTTTAPIFGCDGTTGTGTFSNPAAATPVCAGAATTPTSAFSVVYEADVRNTVPTSGGVPTDCLGAGLAQVAAPVPFRVARNRYYIDVSNDANTLGRPELYCASAGGSSAPLIENVDQLRVWYGMEATVGSRQVVRYALAGQSATAANTVNLVNAGNGIEWSKVVSVRICLLMRSAERVFNETVSAAGNEDSLTYLDCDGESKTSSDRYMRRAYFTTATVRSKMTF